MSPAAAITGSAVARAARTKGTPMNASTRAAKYASRRTGRRVPAKSNDELRFKEPEPLWALAGFCCARLTTRTPSSSVELRTGRIQDGRYPFPVAAEPVTERPPDLRDHQRACPGTRGPGPAGPEDQSTRPPRPPA